MKRTILPNEIETKPIKRGQDDDLINKYVSCYFNQSNENVDDKQNKKPEDFSKRKLINILEDVKLDEQETYKIISNVNIDMFQDVDVITADNTGNNLSPKPAKVNKIKRYIREKNKKKLVYVRSTVTYLFTVIMYKIYLQAVNTLESEEIEEIDISNTHDENVLVPPSQFLDLIQVWYLLYSVFLF